MSYGHVYPVSVETLSGIKLLAQLDLERRKLLAKQCSGLVFAAGQQIVTATDQAHDVYFIVSGAVRVAQYSKLGKEVIFRDLQVGSTFGELSAIDSRPRSAHVLALLETWVVKIEQSLFLSLVREEPTMNLGVMAHLAGLVRSLSDRVFELDALSVNSRIRAELVRVARASTGSGNTAEIYQFPTDEVFARRVGTNREAVNKEFSRMKHMGLIEKSRGRLRVHNVTALEQFANSA